MPPEGHYYPKTHFYKRLYNNNLRRFRAYRQLLIETGEIDENEADEEALWDGFFEDIPLAEINEKAKVRLENRV